MFNYFGSLPLKGRTGDFARQRTRIPPSPTLPAEGREPDILVLYVSW
jgi:hypothetical protein